MSSVLRLARLSRSWFTPAAAFVLLGVIALAAAVIVYAAGILPLGDGPEGVGDTTAAPVFRRLKQKPVTTEKAPPPTPTPSVTSSPTVAEAEAPPPPPAPRPTPTVPDPPPLQPAPSGPVLHVDPANGDDGAEGSAGAPLRTIQRALALTRPGTTVRLGNGVFYEAVETVSAGLADNPIVIEAAPGAHPIIDGRDGELDAPRLVHSYVTLRAVEIRNTKEGVRIERAEGVVLSNNEIHHVLNECLRLRFFARGNRVETNVIHHCGLGGNGEGIYVGTAPEQRGKNGGLPDESSGNYIAANEVYGVEEGVDVKEDAWGTIVAANYVHGATDANSGGINVRGDDNFVVDNQASGNFGSGFRFGGDVADSPRYGGGHQYGTGNVLRGNVANSNAVHGFKFMRGPQTADCSNTGQGNGGQLYYFDDGVEPFFSCP